MIKDCREGKIEMIITKSISRFARNTLDAKGEVLLTILSSLAQDESRSISENST
jgi:DNA invertase Pin-like site-specific DNA recombinase